MSEKPREQESLLDRVYIETPCSMSWDSMTGDERARLCGACSKNVYNISDMTKKEANVFLAQKGTTQCMTFYRRPDGTILTDNCPRVLRKLRDRGRMVARLAAGVLALLLSLPAVAQNASTRRVNNLFSVQPLLPVPSAVLKFGAAGASLAPLQQVLGDPSNMHYVKGEMMIKTPAKLNECLNAIKPHPALVGKPALQIAEPRDKPIVRLRAVETIYMDTKASEYYQKAKAAQEDGKSTLAEFYYERAIESFKAQKVKGDPKFLEQLEDGLKKLKP